MQAASRAVTGRAAALLAAGIHALWTLYYASNGRSAATVGPVAVGCNGSVVERYPRFRERTQRVLDELTALSGAPPAAVVLEVAQESAIFGAAVSVGCLKGAEKRE